MTKSSDAPTPESGPEAEVEAEAGPGPGRPRPTTRRVSRAQAVVAVLLAVLGFAVVTQVRSTQVDDSFSSYREQDLIDVLNGLAGTTQRSQAEITRLEQTRDDLQTTSSKRRAALQQAQTEADNLAILAGTVPVTGPGVRVTIKQVDGRVSLESVIDLVQELRTIGAESIAIAGEGKGEGPVRLVAQSSFEDDADGLVVDGVQLGAPYTLSAIGDPDLLSGAVTFTDGPRSQLEDDGASVAIEKLTALDITAVRDDAAGQ